MADKKKVYSLTINGLKESLDLVKSLTDELKSLDSAIGTIGERKVKVTGTVEVEESKTKVSGGSGTDADRQKQLAIEKQITAEKRAQGQLDAMQTEEYRKSYEAMAQTKDQIKDAKRELDALASGAAELTDEGLQYANTMKGMKAELKALKAERDGLDLAKPEEVERFKEIQQRALELETLLKSLESEAGVFSRNVGNYPQLFRQSTEELANVEKIIVSLSDKLAKATPGTEGYDKLKSELESAEKYADRLRQRLKDVEDEIGTINAAGFKIDVGGKEREFNSMKEAVKTLTQELQQMTLAGEENSQEFEDTIRALGRVKTAISQTSGEIQSYIGNAKGLSDTIEIMRGMGGLFSLGQGFMTLFGGENQELDETLKKFTAITLIMNGLLDLQKQINDGTSIWGTKLKAAQGWINKLTGPIDSFSEKIDEIGRKTAAMKDVLGMEGVPGFNEFNDGLQNAIANVGELDAAWKAMGLQDQILTTVQLAGDLANSLDFEQMNLEGAPDSVIEFYNALKKTYDEVPGFKAQWDALAASTKKSIGSFLAAQNIFRSMPGWMQKMAASSRLVQAGLIGIGKGAQVAAAGLKALGKATIIIGLLQIAMELLQPVLDAISWAVQGLIAPFKALASAVGDLWSSWTGGLVSGVTQESIDSFNVSLEMSKEKVDDFTKSVDRLKKMGAITGVDALNLKVERLGNQFAISVGELRQFIATVDNLDKALSDNLGAIGTWYESGEDSVESFIQRWETLRKAVEAGTDEVEQGGSGWGWWYTASDAVDDFTDANKAMLQDLSHQINQIDFSKPEEAVKQFDALFKGQIGDARNYAYKNIDKLFPEEPWAQMLKARLDAASQWAQQYKDIMAEAGDETARLHREAARQIEDLTNAALPKGQREDAQSKTSRERDIEDVKRAGYAAEDERKLIAGINAKYDRQDKERHEAAAKTRLQNAQQAGQKMEQALKQIRDNLLAIQKDGLDKQIQQLENAMADEIAAARKNGVKVGEVVASIQKKYQYLIAKAREDWQRQQQQRQKQWNKAWEDMMRQHYENLRQMQDEAQSSSIQRDITENENVHTENTQTISYNVEVNQSGSLPDSDRMLQEQKRYYRQMLEEQVAYLEERDRLNREAADTEYENAVDAENRSYEQRLATNKEWYEAQLEQQNEAARNGQVTEEEYQANLLEITNAYHNANANDYEAHNLKLEELDAEHQQTLRNIEVQGNADRQAAESEAISNRISAVQQMYDEIGEYAERKQKENVNRHTGLFSIGTERKRLEEVKAAYETTMQELELAYEDLKAKLNDGEIDFNQFKEAKNQIDSLAKNAKKGADETAENLDDLVQTWGQSMSDFAQKVGQQMQELYSQFDAIWDLKLQAQEDALDREQDYLDKEKDMVEKAYDKQKEIVDRYRDAINDSEDELKSARGERRLALLDGLAQQREAYLNETETLKKQEVEKEKIAKKEEQLKKKQEQLEKQRKKKEQMASIVQATINTALGVTQALGAWPPPASYALAAAVGALGAVQIALIASQKFAKGGVIEGPSHSRGGVTVGFSASGVRQEAEGGEMIVNKRSTRENTELLYFINQNKRHLTREDLDRFYDGKETVRIPARSARFADGGQMPELNDYSDYSPNQPVQVELTLDSKVSVVDIMNATDRLTQTRVLAGLD